MPSLLATVLSPEEEELARKTESLAALEAGLADQELTLAACRADLNHFEKRYLQTVGRRYALLDQLKADIAEARARQHPMIGPQANRPDRRGHRPKRRRLPLVKFRLVRLRRTTRHQPRSPSGPRV